MTDTTSEIGCMNSNNPTIGQSDNDASEVKYDGPCGSCEVRLRLLTEIERLSAIIRIRAPVLPLRIIKGGKTNG